MPQAAVAVSDVTLARSALAAIDADPMLKDVNIIVSVVDRGAVLAGPVSSEGIKKRLEEVVRGVSGIEAVKNTCFVQANPDSLMRATIMRLKSEAKPAITPALPGFALGPNAPEARCRRQCRNLHPTPSAVENNPNTRTSLSPSFPGNNMLAPPVSASPNSKPRPQPEFVKVGKPADLQARIDAIRKKDGRFQNLDAKLMPDGGLNVIGRCARYQDAKDFASQLEKIDGVPHVGIDQELLK